jgi:hypothetical protein
MGIDERLAKALYGPYVYEEGNLPYRLTSDGVGETYGMTNVQHWPGLYGNSKEIPAAPYQGYLGLTVQDYRKPVNSQPVRLCWAVVDIDAGDNCHMGASLLREVVLDVFKHRNCVIRTSKSGAGLHLLFLLEQKEVNYEYAKTLAKTCVRNEMTRALSANINTCVNGLHNVWLVSEGGRQETLSYPQGL